MQPNKYVFGDFEFNGVSEPSLNLVCCTLMTSSGIEEFWLHGKNYNKLRNRLEELQSQGYIFVSYSAEAEASSMISMGVDPLKFKWVDLYLEYRLLQNHNYEFMHGKQYIDGVIKVTAPFGEKGKQNLAAAYYKLCGKLIDTEHKDKMRDIIINGTPEEIEENREHIQKYCTSDVTVLPELMGKVGKECINLVPKRDGYGLYDGNMQNLIEKESYWRAETAVRTAIMVREGYPINVEWTKNLTDNIPHILRDMIQDINEQFPDIKPFNWNKPKFTREGELKEHGKYSMNQKSIKEWIKSQNFKDWDRTESGDISLKLESWTNEFNFRHDFPRGNFGAQMVRYLKTAQSLKGFKDKGGASNNTFWDHVGSDGRVRSYLNPYGAQSSRFQPGSVGFLFLKSAWQRALAQAPKGYAYGSIDYSSQEFLLGGILSGDSKMIDAYRSGDVYLAYGKEIGVIPKDGTKKTHERERDAQKPVILGWQYWISEFGLSKQLTQQTGRRWYPEDALPLIEKLDMVYRSFADFRSQNIDLYESYKYQKQPDGWYMWGDNKSHRSVANCVVQGFGACIIRKAIQLAQDAGLKVVFPLHDALYIIFKSDDYQAMDALKKCMTEAFIFYFKEKDKELANLIRVDGKAWSPDYEDGEFITKSNFVVKTSKYHIDGRSKEEYNQYSKYFTSSPNIELL